MRLLIVLILTLIASFPFAGEASAQGKDYIWARWQSGAFRGVNVLPSITENEIGMLARDWGANLLRVQIIYPADVLKAITDNGVAAAPSQRESLWRVISTAERHGVYVVIDLHKSECGNTEKDARLWDDFAAHERLEKLWKELAKEYGGAPNVAGFDLLNEPTPWVMFKKSYSQIKGTPADWNLLAQRLVTAIRALDAETPIIVESTDWAKAPRFKELAVFTGGRVVYSFHMYYPHEFTHQGIRQFIEEYPYPFQLNGRVIDADALLEWTKDVRDFSARNQAPVFVGEFSAINKADASSRLRYMIDCLDIFAGQGWSWAYHAYNIWAGWMPDDAMKTQLREYSKR